MWGLVWTSGCAAAVLQYATSDTAFQWTQHQQHVLRRWQVQVASLTGKFNHACVHACKLATCCVFAYHPAGIIRPYNVTTNYSCTDPAVCTTPVTVGDEAAAGVHCSAEQLLPCFLRFSDWMVPRGDASNMRCKVGVL
jgi:hypothetical protein